jgi:hypothetical protein
MISGRSLGGMGEARFYRALNEVPKGTGTGSAADNIYLETRSIADEFPELKNINPHYVENAPPGINTNCVSAAICTKVTLEGTPATSVPMRLENGRGYYGSFSDFNAYAPYGTKQTTISDIVGEMSQAGHGSNGFVFINQGKDAPWHVINVVNKQGNVMFIDSQMGKIVVPKPDLNVRSALP